MMKIIILLLTCFFIASCNRIKREGKELVNKVERKSQDASDKVFPHFDAYRPDTKYNKLRFRDFLKVEITPDVKNIYCFDDAIGIDADYQFSFNCSQETANSIIEKNEMLPDSLDSDYQFGLQNDFKWWDKSKIKKLKLYCWENETHQYFKYFWYDKAEKKAYFFDFDM